MLRYFKEQLTAPWDFMRVLRVFVGVAVLAQSWQTGDAMLGMLGGLFAIQGLLNAGCCSTASCYTPVRKQVDEKEVEYTEIK